MKVNKSAGVAVAERKMDKSNRLAGGYGVFAANQDAEALLRRAVMACLLWEDVAYEDGSQVAANISELIPRVAPEKVAEIAIEARVKQKLRHVPLFIAREMARLGTHKHLVGNLLPRIILRADELTEFLALYMKDGRKPLSAQVKKGLAKAFTKFNEYQLAKYDRATEFKLRDVAFLTHPNPGTSSGKLVPGVDRPGYKRGEVLRDPDTPLSKLVSGTLPVPDTWEVALSSGEDKKAAWERLISERKLGALAFVRNLRNMVNAGVDEQVVLFGFKTIDPGWLLPLNYLAAAEAAPHWTSELEKMMLRGLQSMPKLPGYTVFVIDVSGSMLQRVSAKSSMNRLHAGAAMAMLAAEVCERVTVYATAGNDRERTHKTEKLNQRRGFALIDEIDEAAGRLGGGGIFTRQCLEYIKTQEHETPDRIIVFSDSQDCDAPSSGLPRPFGKHNYIVDVSSHARGVNYDGVWSAEVSGWSEHFLTYIAALEGIGISQEVE